MLINQESIKLALRITTRSEKEGRVIALYVTGNISIEEERTSLRGVQNTREIGGGETGKIQ